MASRREMEALIVLAGRVDPSLQRAMRAAQSHADGVTKSAGIMGKATSKAFNIMKTGAAIGAAGIGFAIAAVAKQGIALASDLTEVQNVVDVTFGKNANQINSWSKTALNSFGLSELSAKQYSSSLGAMMKSSGISSKYLVSMSENLTGLSGDFASFYNLDPADAFQKIQSGISGETEPLKQIGINMNVANLQAYALAHGIKTAYGKMSQADQTILRYNYLLEASKDAQGDFIRTQASYANQQRLFQENFKQLSATIMKAALPALTSLLQKGNQMISTFANDPQKIAKLQQVIGNVFDKIVAAVPTVINLAGQFVTELGNVFNVAANVFHFIHDHWVVIEPMIVGIVAAMVAWKAITLGMAAYQGIMGAIRGATVAATVAQWGMNAAVLANPMTWVVLAIAAAIGIWVAAIYVLYKNWDKVSAFLSSSWEMVKQGFASGINFIVDKLNWLIEKMNMIPGVNIDLIPKMDTGAVQAATQVGGKAASIQKFAVGGFASRPSIFGEAGPEAAIPLRRTPRSLGLLSKTAEVLGVGGGGGGNPTFVFAPNYGGAGGSSATDLKSAFEDFKAQCDEWWESKRRESFAD